MGRFIQIDRCKVREELKSAERSLEYWKNLEGKHLEGNRHFEVEIARASAKIDAFKFVLNQCSR